MSTDPQLRDILRDTRLQQHLPAHARCWHCGTVEQLVLRTEPLVCYEHQEGPADRIEQDHIAGRANLPAVTLPLRANAHRRVTRHRSVLGKDEWPAANGDPLLACAHLLAGLASILWLLAEWLKEVALFLAERHGPAWYHGLPAFPLPL